MKLLKPRLTKLTNDQIVSLATDYNNMSYNGKSRGQIRVALCEKYNIAQVTFYRMLKRIEKEGYGKAD